MYSVKNRFIIFMIQPLSGKGSHKNISKSLKNSSELLKSKRFEIIFSITPEFPIFVNNPSGHKGSNNLNNV